MSWEKLATLDVLEEQIEGVSGSTMTSMAEVLGMTLPGCAAIPAPDSRRLAIAEDGMIWFVNSPDLGISINFMSLLSKQLEVADEPYDH